MERTNYPQIAPEDFKASWVEKQSNEEYHADKSAVSSSSLRLMVTRSPAHFHAQHVLAEKQEETAAMQFGSLVHEAILEPQVFRNRVRVMPDFGDLRKADNREKKAQWHSDLPPTALVVGQEEADKLIAISESVMKHDIAAGVLAGAQFEKSGYYRDPVTGIKCRIRPDAWNPRLGILADIKTTQDASLDAFMGSIAKYGYHFQMGMYEEAIKIITGQAPRISCFIAVEKNPPYAVAVYQCDEAILSTGNHQYRRALDKLLECMAIDYWPSYQDKKSQTITLPRWYMYQLQDLMEG